MRRLLFTIALCGLAGCTGSAEEIDLSRFQLEQQTAEIGHANSMRSLIESLHHQLKTEGVDGLQSDLRTLDERLEEFTEDEIEGPARKTYDLIIPRLKEVAKKVNSGSANKTELDELLQELQQLALSLPKSETKAPAKS